MTADFRADLHCHTTCSDGSLSPEELVMLAVQKGLKGLSITDHDTIAAYSSAVQIAAREKIELLPGVEFSSVQGSESVHILAYGFSLKSQVILEFCERHQERRKERNRRILAKLAKLGMVIEEQELKTFASETIGRPHIASLMVKKGFVKDLREAFQSYLKEGGRGYDPGEPFSSEETVALIHKGGGKAILAHPHLIKRKKTVKALLTLPFDGLEGYYAHLSKDQEKKWVEIAKEKGWLITGGSDYHGAIRPHVSLGSSWVCYETFHIFYTHYRHQSAL